MTVILRKTGGRGSWWRHRNAGPRGGAHGQAARSGGTVRRHGQAARSGGTARRTALTFTNGPVSLVDPDTIEQLGAPVDRPGSAAARCCPTWTRRPGRTGWLCPPDWSATPASAV
ncbi:MAG TPA: hypothetical protein VLW50_12275 [Streptosporangiaceae bacterium]|nr:hypothetical protein [Streptosporangiaceae bacterium]